MNYQALVLVAVQAALDAGKAIMAIYDSPIEVSYKEDKSPLTSADRAAHGKIVGWLQQKTPNIPVLSEEGRSIPYEERCQWECFWLVDPLDGTKEFIKKNGEFTVNIALIKAGKPVLGVIYVPCRDHLYFACQGVGSFKIDDCRSIQADTPFEALLNTGGRLPLNGTQHQETIRVVGSRSHGSDEFQDYIQSLKSKYESVEITPAGSSLKFCLVAEGQADIYPRLGPTMEWDTGAGQAISEQAGCPVINVDTNLPLQYNKQNLRNSFFRCARERHLAKNTDLEKNFKVNI